MLVEVIQKRKKYGGTTVNFSIYWKCDAECLTFNRRLGEIKFKKLEINMEKFFCNMENMD